MFPTDFKALRLKLASPEEILAWSCGEVKKPETINYRTQRPEKDGLFSEKIFGPIKDWECYCGKYKRIRYKGIVCDKCGVEVTRSIVRRDRMGHIKLATPVSHIWFLRGVPSKLGLILNLSVRNLEKVVYFASYIITSVDEEAKNLILGELEDEFKSKKKLVSKRYETKINELRARSAKEKTKKSAETLDDKIAALYEEKVKEMDGLEKSFSRAKDEITDLEKLKIISELEFRDLSLKYGHVFQAGTGAEAVYKILKEIDLEKLVAELEVKCKNTVSQEKKKIRRRLNLVRNLIRSNIRPEWTILTVLPVMPPDLRPMVQLDGGRFAASDLNDLYRRVINRNNRLKRLIELNAPEVICRNEKRMLQEAVDALIDNTAKAGKEITSAAQKRPLKSLADLLKGKQGRFRQNLLGKRVDYSGRSVIVIGPELKLSECGIPKTMALELFKPFVINKLISGGFAHNVRTANKLVEEGAPEVWDILEDVICDRHVLLNRAPTLHRLGIQAFRPILIEGKAIRIHPMVCTAFNADFDGDQMAVHVPLTQSAQSEAKNILASINNLLKPSTGSPITTASQDIVLGCYYITNIRERMKGEGMKFSNIDEAILAYENNLLDIRAKIKVRLLTKGKEEIIETCAGRIIFNGILPSELPFFNKVLDKKVLSKLIGEIFNRFGKERVVKLVDDIKKIGFSYLTRAGLSWGMNDLAIPAEKQNLILKANEEVEKLRQQYKVGLLTEQEKYIKIIETWTRIKNQITDLVMSALDKNGSVYSMVDSGARGSWPQIVQMAGMRGLMAAPSGKTIELPVKDSFKEGLSVLEYFISTHGARKGLTDTALRTANAGYLTRRLIDVVQDLTIQAEDCVDDEGIAVTKKESDEMNETLAKRILGRFTISKILDPKTKEAILDKDELITREKADEIEEKGIEEIQVRSPMSCKLKQGICQKCYGWDLGKNKIVDLGQAVGIVAAQSIGEPGTQLTMRTFHTGGVAGEGDITQGLPRVEELFEARGVREPALIADIDGLIHIEEEKDRKIIRIISQEAKKETFEIRKGDKVKVKDKEKVQENQTLFTRQKEKIKAIAEGVVKLSEDKLEILHEGAFEKEYVLPSNTIIWVRSGDKVGRGQQLTEGHVDLQQLFKLSGRQAVQKYILKEVQYIYSSQGQDLNDKHVEMIIRRMLSWIKITNSGDSEFLPGDVVDRIKFEEIKGNLRAEKKEVPEGVEILLGITKASLATESFLSAASFQETARVLIDAAITGKVDELKGLKENVIIGKLIPAGTGFCAGKLVK
jgi:DNA-directed RNA polymerase subunit beta'